MHQCEMEQWWEYANWVFTFYSLWMAYYARRRIENFIDRQPRRYVVSTPANAFIPSQTDSHKSVSDAVANYTKARSRVGFGDDCD